MSAFPACSVWNPNFLLWRTKRHANIPKSASIVYYIDVDATYMYTCCSTTLWDYGTIATVSRITDTLPFWSLLVPFSLSNSRLVGWGCPGHMSRRSILLPTEKSWLKPWFSCDRTEPKCCTAKSPNCDSDAVIWTPMPITITLFRSRPRKPPGNNDGK